MSRASAAALAMALLLATLAGSCSRDSFQRGMVYGIFSRGGTAYHRRNLEEMTALGVDHVQIVVPHSLPSIHASAFSPPDPLVTPTRASLEEAVTEAQRLGLRVFLLPIINVQHLEEGEWRGVLQPLDLDIWWDNYTRLIVAEASWAASRDIDIFAVGSELCSLEGQKQRWLELIARVRAVFPGKITYSANWDHLDGISFISALDFAGMNAYHEVGGEGATLEDLLSRWQQILVGLDSWQKSHGLPVLVTEIGYQSRAGSTADPWNYGAPGAVDGAEQDLGYRAFIQAWSGRRWFAGCYFYLWWDEEDGGRGYTPRGKAAAGSLRRWYTEGHPVNP